MLRSHPLRGALLALVLLLVPATAHAAQITGDPLTVSSSDSDGRLGIGFTDSNTSEFFGGFFNSETGELTPASNAGFTVVTVDGNSVVEKYLSRQGGVTPTSAPVVTGDGSAGSPFRIVQTFRGGTELDLRQELTYVNGETSVRARLDVRNIGSNRLLTRAAMGADLYGGGSDVGMGLLEQGPPRFVGGFNDSVGSVAGLTEITGWSHFEEGGFSGVLSRADADPRSESLADIVDPNEVDNGVAVQWDGQTLSPGDSANYEVAWRFSRTFDLDPQQASLTTGDPATFTVKLRNTAGSAQANIPVRYSVSGTNTATGVARTAGDGSATFEYVGANPGSDTVTVFADLNGNGARDQGEPQREAQVFWTGLEAPQFAREVNLKPVSGRVLVRLPRNAKVKGKWAQAAQSSFVKLESVQQVPVGSELDTRAGRVQLTSSVTKGGDTVQTSQFYSGRFTVAQRSRDRGLTEIRLSEPLACRSSSRGKELTTAARRSRRLWGRGRGRFRTRGRYSSATVRGTAWLTKDSCSSTITTVREGIVTVRDFAKRKNVRVRAPKSYRARARRR